MKVVIKNSFNSFIQQSSKFFLPLLENPCFLLISQFNFFHIVKEDSKYHELFRLLQKGKAEPPKNPPNFFHYL